MCVGCGQWLRHTWAEVCTASGREDAPLYMQLRCESHYKSSSPILHGRESQYPGFTCTGAASTGSGRGGGGGGSSTLYTQHRRLSLSDSPGLSL